MSKTYAESSKEFREARDKLLIAICNLFSLKQRFLLIMFLIICLFISIAWELRVNQ